MNFQSERLFLSPTTTEDAPLFFKLLNTPKWLQFIGDRNVKTLEDSANYIQERVVPHYEKLGYGNYTLSLKSDGTKIGCCGLYDRKYLEGVDIGFALLPDYEKKGYGYEAAIKVKELAFKTFQLKKIGAITVKANVGSQKLLEKLGLEFVKMIVLENDPEELMYYEIISS